MIEPKNPSMKTTFLSNSLYGSEFKTIFRISRSRFEDMMEKIMNEPGLVFYQDSRGRQGRTSSCLEGMLLYPLKTLAFGVPYSAFVDYFQISIQFGMKLCCEFDNAVKTIYMREFLRVPDDVDLRNIEKLHLNVHGVHGMLGSLDCSHTKWKNCPKAWAGSYQGKENSPSVVLEGISDYHMFFWHASYGYAGTLNDKTIFDLSPFQECLLDGSFEERERQSGVVPYRIADEEFNKMFVLVDGIYMNYSRFVKGIKIPSTNEEAKYTEWQEGVRKDIERAFGNLKTLWKFISRPIEIWNLSHIANRVTTALILHNVVVSDRVMGDVHHRYNPAETTEYLGDFGHVVPPHVIHQMDGMDVNCDNNQNDGNGNVETDENENENRHVVPQAVVDVINAAGQWENLKYQTEHCRLRSALMNKINE